MEYPQTAPPIAAGDRQVLYLLWVRTWQKQGRIQIPSTAETTIHGDFINIAGFHEMLVAAPRAGGVAPRLQRRALRGTLRSVRGAGWASPGSIRRPGPAVAGLLGLTIRPVLRVRRQGPRALVVPARIPDLRPDPPIH